MLLCIINNITITDCNCHRLIGRKEGRVKEGRVKEGREEME